MESLPEWVQVPGYEGVYEAARHGEIRRAGKTNPIKTCRNKKHKGYHKLQLWFIGIPKGFFLHVLIAEIFIGPRPGPRWECNHKNGDKDDNSAGNLEWLDKPDHDEHTFETGLLDCYSGENHPNAVLTVEAVRWARENAGSLSCRGMARKLGVHHETLRMAIRGESWRREVAVDGKAEHTEKHPGPAAGGHPCRDGEAAPQAVEVQEQEDRH